MNRRLRPAPSPNEGGDRTMLSLFGAAHVWEDRLESALAAVGLSVAKLGVLTQLIDAGEPLPLSELAARLSCVRSNMTQLVDRLESEGLVRRVHDAADRRSVRASVTRLGEERHAAGAAELARIGSEFAEQLSPLERGALGKALATLR